MLKKTDNKGFTIIEVLIVLAIAGLIMLVVFLAVPALQRNSRNTQRKNDVSATLGAVSEYVGNNAGKLPTTGANLAAAFTSSVPKLGFYTDPTVITYNYSATARTGAVPTPPTGNDSAAIYNYAKCDSASTATFTSASVRSVIVLYNVEGSGGDQPQCQES